MEGIGVILHGIVFLWAMKLGFFHQDVKGYPGEVQDQGRRMTRAWIIMESPSTPGNTNSVKILRSIQPSSCNYHLRLKAWGYKCKDCHIVVLCKWCVRAELPGGLTVQLLPTKLLEVALWVTALGFNIVCSIRFCILSLLFGMGNAFPGIIIAFKSL